MDVMLGCASLLDTRQVVTALIAVVNPQELRTEGWPKNIATDFVRLRQVFDQMLSLISTEDL